MSFFSNKTKIQQESHTVFCGSVSYGQLLHPCFDPDKIPGGGGGARGYFLGKVTLNSIICPFSIFAVDLATANVFTFGNVCNSRVYQ